MGDDRITIREYLHRERDYVRRAVDWHGQGSYRSYEKLLKLNDLLAWMETDHERPIFVLSTDYYGDWLFHSESERGLWLEDLDDHDVAYTLSTRMMTGRAYGDLMQDEV